MWVAVGMPSPCVLLNQFCCNTCCLPCIAQLAVWQYRGDRLSTAAVLQMQPVLQRKALSYDLELLAQSHT